MATDAAPARAAPNATTLVAVTAAKRPRTIAAAHLRCMATTSEASRPQGIPQAPHHSTGMAAIQRALPRPPDGPAVPVGSANLDLHPFGGGVIGNTTGSGPVIEGSSPSPRAPAGSRCKPETSARPHRLEA